MRWEEGKQWGDTMIGVLGPGIGMKEDSGAGPGGVVFFCRGHDIGWWWCRWGGGGGFGL